VNVDVHVVLCTGCFVKKTKSQLFVTSQRCQILTDFHNSFSDTLRRTLAVQRSLNIPPHLKCFATLPCKDVSVSVLAVMLAVRLRFGDV